MIWLHLTSTPIPVVNDHCSIYGDYEDLHIVRLLYLYEIMPFCEYILCGSVI